MSGVKDTTSASRYCRTRLLAGVHPVTRVDADLVIRAEAGSSTTRHLRGLRVRALPESARITGGEVEVRLVLLVRAGGHVARPSSNDLVRRVWGAIANTNGAHNDALSVDQLEAIVADTLVLDHIKLAILAGVHLSRRHTGSVD